MRPLTVEQLRGHPELAVLWALDGQMEAMTLALAAVHGADERNALAEQARSMVRVSRVLLDQLRAYRGLIEVDAKGIRRIR